MKILDKILGRHKYGKGGGVNPDAGKIVEAEYRDGANYKQHPIFVILPTTPKLSAGDEEINVSAFGMTEKEWYDSLPNDYDSEIDHPLVDILEIRERKPDDLPINEK
jgi:hypothetical protein